MIDFTLHNAVIVIVGASSGIGRACAINCVAQGATVIAVGRNADGLQQTSTLSGDCGRCVACCCDVLDKEQFPARLVEVIARIGKVTGLIYSAGIASTVPLRMLSEEHILKEYAVNTVGAINTAKLLAAPRYLSPDGASFVFISSASAHIGRKAKISYAASKGALLSASRAMAAELAAKRIRVNTISPGYIQGTGITATDLASLPAEAAAQIEREHLLGMGTPDDVAGAAVFLVSAAARWITGTDLSVDGGFSLR